MGMLRQCLAFVSLLTAKEKRQLCYLALAVVGLSFVEMTGIATIMPFMAVVSNPEIVQSHVWLKKSYQFLGCSNSLQFLAFLGSGLLGVMILANILKSYTAWLRNKNESRINYHLSQRLLAHYLSRPYSFFLNRNSAEIGKNVLAEVHNVIAGFLSPALQVLTSGLMSLFIVLLLMVIEPLVTCVSAVVIGGFFLCVYRTVKNRLERIGQEQVAAATMRHKTTFEALGGIKDLKILGRESDLLARFGAHARKYAHNIALANTISQIPRNALEVMAMAGVILIVLYFLQVRGSSAESTIPYLALYVFAAYRLLPALQQIFHGIANMQYNRASLDVLRRDLMANAVHGDAELLLQRAGEALPLPFCREVALRDAHFAYAAGGQEVVAGVSLAITRNTTVGLVGATGSGKTTLVDIVLGLLPLNSGQILVDGHELRADQISSWQRNFGYVPQHIYLSDDTVARNIAFGVPEAKVNMEAVRRAARIANLHELIEQELPKGYDTIIGERGVRLSGGQRQRIGIARALYHDPSILIMDEATNALDGITEEAVMEALRRLAGQKTIIMIAHRLTTVKECDVIYLMDRGKIINSGTYDELQRVSRWFRKAAR